MRRPVAYLVLAFGLPSCAMIGPNYGRPPDAPRAQHWAEAGDVRTTATGVDTTRWWHTFEDPVLDELIAQARARNFTLQVAALRVLEARALRAVAFGALFPQQQTLGTSYLRGRISKNRSPTAQTFSSELWDLTFDVSWEIDLWGRLRRGVEAADAQVLAQLADYDDVLVTLLGDVASTYVQIRVLEERLALARDNVRVQREGLEIARVRYEAGGTSELDWQQARTLLADTEASIPQLDIGLRQTEHALSVLLGSAPEGVPEVLGRSRGIPVVPPTVAAGIPADLLRRRPDVRRAERELAAQCARIGVAKADLLPTLQLTGAVGLTSATAAKLFAGRSFEALGGPSVTWPILNYGRIVNAVRAQDARFEALAAAYVQTVLQARAEVEDALIGYVRGIEQVKLLAESVEAANRAVELSLIQYREGAADYTRVLTTQQSKLREEDGLATSRGAMALAVVSLYRAMGGGWEVREGQELVPAATRDRMRRRTYWGGMLETRSVTGPPADEPNEGTLPNAGADAAPPNDGQGTLPESAPAAADE